MGKVNEVKLFKNAKEIKVDVKIYACICGFFVFSDYWTRPQSGTEFGILGM